ncbi:hypothetical protein FB451DRAFT_1385477 [Mycena latifolia]|nr:hypothetical protein FB451DRAFT_1385477 [Mycena latifolia]
MHAQSHTLVVLGADACNRAIREREYSSTRLAWIEEFSNRDPPSPPSPARLDAPLLTRASHFPSYSRGVRTRLAHLDALIECATRRGRLSLLPHTRGPARNRPPVSASRSYESERGSSLLEGSMARAAEWNGFPMKAITLAVVRPLLIEIPSMLSRAAEFEAEIHKCVRARAYTLIFLHHTAAAILISSNATLRPPARCSRHRSPSRRVHSAGRACGGFSIAVGRRESLDGGEGAAQCFEGHLRLVHASPQSFAAGMKKRIEVGRERTGVRAGSPPPAFAAISHFADAGHFRSRDALALRGSVLSTRLNPTVYDGRLHLFLHLPVARSSPPRQKTASTSRRSLASSATSDGAARLDGALGLLLLVPPCPTPESAEGMRPRVAYPPSASSSLPSRPGVYLRGFLASIAGHCPSLSCTPVAPRAPPPLPLAGRLSYAACLARALTAPPRTAIRARPSAAEKKRGGASDAARKKRAWNPTGDLSAIILHSRLRLCAASPSTLSSFEFGLWRSLVAKTRAEVLPWIYALALRARSSRSSKGRRASHRLGQSSLMPLLSYLPASAAGAETARRILRRPPSAYRGKPACPPPRPFALVRTVGAARARAASRASSHRWNTARSELDTTVGRMRNVGSRGARAGGWTMRTCRAEMEGKMEGEMEGGMEMAREARSTARFLPHTLSDYGPARRGGAGARFMQYSAAPLLTSALLPAPSAPRLERASTPTAAAEAAGPPTRHWRGEEREASGGRARAD